MLCLAVSTGKKQEVAFTDSKAEVTPIVPEVELTADKVAAYVRRLQVSQLFTRHVQCACTGPSVTKLRVQARGVLVGGPGVFRADGRTHFGCRQLVSKLNPPLVTEEGVLPVSFWRGREGTATDILEAFLRTRGSAAE